VIYFKEKLEICLTLKRIRRTVLECHGATWEAARCWPAHLLSMEPNGVRTDELIRRLADSCKIDLAPMESRFAWLLVSACVPRVEGDLEAETDYLTSQIRQRSALNPSHRSAICILLKDAMLDDVEHEITPGVCLVG